MSPDSELARAVQLLLRSHPAFFGQHITATAEDGVVVLTGTVDATPYARAARNGARRVPGVHSVVDELQLRPRAGARRGMPARHQHAGGRAVSVRAASKASQPEGVGHEGTRLPRARRESVGGRT